MNNSNSFFYRNIILILTFVITFINLFVFFYIKNSTHYLKIQAEQLENDVLMEQHNLLTQMAQFNKQYNVHNLQELASNKLKLHFSNVNQITTIDELMDR